MAFVHLGDKADSVVRVVEEICAIQAGQSTANVVKTAVETLYYLIDRNVMAALLDSAVNSAYVDFGIFRRYKVEICSESIGLCRLYRFDL